MPYEESERFEKKYKVTTNICKTVVAFANSKGGLIYVGIDDFGNVVGVEDADAEMLKVSSLVRDDICPELLQFVSIDAIELEGKTVLRVEVEPGDDPPYYLAAKGLVPAGVYLRVGPASMPANRSTIRRMIREADGDSFETRRSREQELTFEYAELTFKRQHVAFEERHFGALGLYAADGFYSNLALLISDQNPYQLKCATFNDDAFTEFLTRKECDGSIFQQFDEAFEFLDNASNLRSYFPSVYRVDVKDFPSEAIREGLLNSIIHRDYEATGPALVKANRTRMDFLTLGGLYNITVDAALDGHSSSRNPKLHAMFHRLGIVEAYGSGLQKIFTLYEHENLKPRIEGRSFSFMLSLPNVNTTNNPDMNYTSNWGPSLRGSEMEIAELAVRGRMPADVLAEYERDLQRFPQRQIIHEHVRQNIEDEERRARQALERANAAPQGIPPEARASLDMNLAKALLEYASDAGEFSREEAQEALHANRDTTLKTINELIEEGKLERVGRARATRYRAAG